MTNSIALRGGGGSASLREALPGNAKKRSNVFTGMVLLHIYSKKVLVLDYQYVL